MSFLSSYFLCAAIGCGSEVKNICFCRKVFPMTKKVVVCVAVMLSIVSLVFTSALAKSNPNLWCEDRDCSILGGCTFSQQPWPQYHLCIIVSPTTSRDCRPTPPSVGEWRCVTTNGTALCGKIYKNSISRWGNPEGKCTGTGGGCVPSQYVGEIGNVIVLCSDEQL